MGASTVAIGRSRRTTLGGSLVGSRLVEVLDDEGATRRSAQQRVSRWPRAGGRGCGRDERQAEDCGRSNCGPGSGAEAPRARRTTYPFRWAEMTAPEQLQDKSVL